MSRSCLPSRASYSLWMGSTAFMKAALSLTSVKITPFAFRFVGGGLLLLRHHLALLDHRLFGRLLDRLLDLLGLRVEPLQPHHGQGRRDERVGVRKVLRHLVVLHGPVRLHRPLSRVHHALLQRRVELPVRKRGRRGPHRVEGLDHELVLHGPDLHSLEVHRHGDRTLRTVEASSPVIEEAQPFDVHLLGEQLEQEVAQLPVGRPEHVLLALEQIGEIERLELGHERPQDRRGDPSEFDLARLQKLDVLAFVPELRVGIDVDDELSTRELFHAVREEHVRFVVGVAFREDGGELGDRDTGRCLSCETRTQEEDMRAGNPRRSATR